MSTTAGQTATATTAASLTANLPSTATPVAAANLPSANTASSTYTEADLARGLRQSRRRAHHQSLFHQHRGRTPGKSTLTTPRMPSASGGFPYSSGPLATQTLNFDPTTGGLSSGSPLSIAVPNGQTMYA